MNVPSPPLYTGQVELDIELIKTYIADLYASLISNVQSGYSVTGLAEDRGLASGDTLAQTQAVVGTMINDLLSKGIIAP